MSEKTPLEQTPFWIHTKKHCAFVLPMRTEEVITKEICRKLLLDKDKIEGTEEYQFSFTKISQEEMKVPELSSEYTWLCVRVFQLDEDGKIEQEIIPEEEDKDRVNVHLYFLPKEATQSYFLSGDEVN